MAVGDWVPCQNYGSQTTLDIQPPGADLLSFDTILVAAGPDNIGEFGDVGSVETEQEVLTKRVVGWVNFRAAVVEPIVAQVHERIRVGLRDDAGNVSVFAEDFQDASQANEPFLWERVMIMEIGQAGNTWPQPDFGHPGWSQIDVRVARRLRRQDVLLYSIKARSISGQPWDITDVFTFFPHLRTWARALS